MQTRSKFSPSETAQLVESYGLDVHLYRQFLEMSVAIHRENLNITSRLLSDYERDEYILMLMQGELALSILTRADLLR